MSQQGSGTVSAREIKQGLKQDMDQLRDDLGRLKTDVTGTARDLAGVARSGVQQAGEYVSEAVHTVRERGEESLDATRDAIKQNPLASVGIAFGVGILLGALLRRL